MKYFGLLIVAVYAAFVTGASIQQYKAHKKWETETLPLIRENAKLKCLLELAGK